MFEANNILNAVLTPREKSRVSNFTIDCYFKVDKLYLHFMLQIWLIILYSLMCNITYILRTFTHNILVKHVSKYVCKNESKSPKCTVKLYYHFYEIIQYL